MSRPRAEMFLLSTIEKIRMPSNLSPAAYRARVFGTRAFGREFMIVAGSDEDLKEIWKMIGSSHDLNIDAVKTVIICQENGEGDL